jgi:hypothetical protein
MIAGIKITIGDAERVVPPLNLSALIEFKERLKAFKPDTFDPDTIELIADCAFRSLKRNYPETTMEWVRENVDVGNMHDVMAAVMDASGLRRKRIEAGGDPVKGGPQSGEAQTTTGTGSS